MAFIFLQLFIQPLSLKLESQFKVELAKTRPIDIENIKSLERSAGRSNVYWYACYNQKAHPPRMLLSPHLPAFHSNGCLGSTNQPHRQHISPVPPLHRIALHLPSLPQPT